LGSGTISKNYTYTNTTTNTNFLFCAQPDRTLFVDPIIQFKQGTVYPQRTWDPARKTYTSTPTNQILYLLATADGGSVTFQVRNIAQQALSEVVVNATRTIDGSTVAVADGTTDSAGGVTFWLDSDFQHVISFVKSGFTTQSTTIFPTQSIYTITMVSSTPTTTTPPQQGINATVKPALGFLQNDTIYNFNYTIVSGFWDVDSFGFQLYYANDTNIGNMSSTASAGGTLNLAATTSNSSKVYMNYFYETNSTFVNGTKVWLINYGGDTSYSINNFFNRFSTYLDADLLGVKGEAGNSDFGKAFISFLFLVLIVGSLSFRYGIVSEGAIMGIIFGVVMFLDVGIGLIPTPFNAVPNFPTIFVGILLLATLFKEEVSR